jgi:hypothetical protein
MATLPLFCLGTFHAPDAQTLVTERFDVWHSLLVVTREVLRSASALEPVDATVAALLATTGGLRDAFLALLNAKTLSRREVRKAYALLTEMYRQLATGVENLARELELDEQVLPARGSIMLVTFERSLHSFGDALGISDADDLSE